ncbi:MAG: MarR family transcriptional regulator [Gammaproteobacteria bacterium]|nr:MarR family transcriptional regulator [Gammaproteobacteria bacterium]
MKDYDEILISLRKIMRATDLHSQKLMKESGLTAPQLLVMQAIEKEGDPSTSTLARHIAVSQATMTRIVDRLERAGLVRRQKSNTDRRVINVGLTDAGRIKLESAPEPLQAEFLRRFRTLEDWEQQMLKSSLLRVAKMMDAEDIDAAPILQIGSIVEPSAGE